ncbi:hypothetical protein EMCRGX_G016181 [Ephydatia muelleri]
MVLYGNVCKRFLMQSPFRALQKLPLKVRTMTTVLARHISGGTSKRGPVSWASLALMVVAGGGVVMYVQKVRQEKDEAREREKTRSLGKAALGGPFSLVDHNGQPKTDKSFLGQWMLIYFGFTFCPDVCPDELEKMASVINKLDSTPGLPKLQPLFITVDPERDTPTVIKKYLEDFHPRMLGLTGSPEQIQQVARAYRVYYSPAPVDDNNDYLVDHTIIMYLVGPDGAFKEYFGQNRKAEEISAAIANHMIAFSRSR